jgi:hypothetical protein
VGRARGIARYHAGPAIWLYAITNCDILETLVDGYMSCFKGKMFKRGNMTAILIDIKNDKYLGGNIDEKPCL